DFIASGMTDMIGGFASAAILIGFAWWAPIVLVAAWLATHWLLRESAVWQDRNTPEVRAAQRDADYAYRLAVDPPASKELRLFGFGGFSWALDGASAPVAAVLRLERSMAPKGALSSGRRDPSAVPTREIRFRNVRFAYDGAHQQPVLDGFDLTIPAGTSLAIV